MRQQLKQFEKQIEYQQLKAIIAVLLKQEQIKQLDMQIDKITMHELRMLIKQLDNEIKQENQLLDQVGHKIKWYQEHTLLCEEKK